MMSKRLRAVSLTSRSMLIEADMTLGLIAPENSQICFECRIVPASGVHSGPIRSLASSNTHETAARRTSVGRVHET